MPSPDLTLTRPDPADGDLFGDHENKAIPGIGVPTFDDEQKTVWWAEELNATWGTLIGALWSANVYNLFVDSVNRISHDGGGYFETIEVIGDSLFGDPDDDFGVLVTETDGEKVVNVFDADGGAVLHPNILNISGVDGEAFIAATGVTIQNGAFAWTDGGCAISNPAVNKVLLGTQSGDTFSMLLFAGATSSYPALKRSSAILEARLADDSAYAILRGATPSGSNDLTTKGYVDGLVSGVDFPVDTVFGRTGAVVAVSGDYTAAQVTNAMSIAAANVFATGLGAIAHITGPSDQSFAIAGGAGQLLTLTAPSGLGLGATNLKVFLDNSGVYSWTDGDAQLGSYADRWKGVVAKGLYASDQAKGLVLQGDEGTPHYWRLTIVAGTPTWTDLGTTPPTL